MPNMVVICDSRGRHLQDYISNTSITVLTYSGAKLEDLLFRSQSRCSMIDPEYILILGGICNMSNKDRRSGKITLVTRDEMALLDHMKSAFTAAWETAHELYPHKQVIFSGLCGMDLNRYNGLTGYHPDQHKIDNVIHLLNHHIVDLNFRSGVYQPKLTSKVHRRSNSHGHRNQYRLLLDGIHPGPVVLKDWAKNINSLFNLLQANNVPH